MKYRRDKKLNKWSTPYLPIDPTDVGREYEADVIRINSQSGKGGVAYILHRNFGYMIPKAMREELGYMVKNISDRKHKELSPDDVCELFEKEYVNVFDPIDITDASFQKVPDYDKSELPDGIRVDINVTIKDKQYEFDSLGNGRLDAISNALKKSPYTFDYEFITYSEHALTSDSSSKAVAYIAIAARDGRIFWGVGTHDDIILASVNALVSALNRQNAVDKFVK